MTFTQKIIDVLMEVYPGSLTTNQIIEQTDLESDTIDKAISSLQKEHYPIYNDGSTIGLIFPLISKELIEKQVKPLTVGKTICLLPSLESTNNYAKEHLDVLENGQVILSHEQTAGKGRLGRAWSSPVGKSISMSIVLKPVIELEDISLLTQLTAAALVDALKNTVDAKIKWPNDIIIDRKKIAGILIETEFSGSILKGIIIGIGINTNLEQDDIPIDLQNKATSLREAADKKINPNTLLSSFFSSFDKYYTPFLKSRDTEPFLSVCRKESILLGKDYWIINKKNKKKAFIQDISSSGGLVVRYLDNNQTVTLTSTDLSIRSDQGYI